MPSELKFTTDHRFRLVDADKKLADLLSKKSLVGEALDEYVVRECLPSFLQRTVDAFKGIETKRFPVKIFSANKKTLDVLFSLKPVYDKKGSVKNLKGRITLSKEAINCLNQPLY